MQNLKSYLEQLMVSRDLSFEQAQGLMQRLMRGEATSAQVAALLTALSMKGESATEIAAGIKVMRDHVYAIHCDDADAVDVVGTGGDKLGTYNISTAAAFVVAGAGVTVAKHGNKALSSRSGSADVLASLGINTGCSPQTMERCLKEIKIAFLFAPSLHPSMRHVTPVRREMGVRTIFNLLGPMTNPAGVERGVIGAFSLHYTQLLAEAALQLGCKHMLFVHGDDGLDELSMTGSSQVFEVKDGAIRKYTINPEDYGFELCKMDALIGGEPADNAVALRAVLAGEKSPYADAVIFNAGATLHTSGKFADWASAIAAARASITSGAALKKLDGLAALTQADAE
jgi:anthranilate phosphoribosyltransferase